MEFVPIGGKKVNLIKIILNVHWSIWMIVLAATLNFIIALGEGSSVNLLACIACLIGLAGVLHKSE
ncbi:MAG: hypothetical protein LUQ38_01740 [Methanotrichaceae archaeon]|nr:hypothetical protein [Methanotrichaceae archaeon]MDD1757164.1 hypothetical protein [Methanotrichaceae archaeon]